MIQDPAAELAALVRRSGDAPTAADQRAAGLIQRRFGLALPPPFATVRADDLIPVRPARRMDGPAIAAVKWRSFRVAYRGLMPEDFLDNLEYHPTAAEWSDRAERAPVHSEAVLVAGRPGHVHGFVAAGPASDADLDPVRTGQIHALYLDPSIYRHGVGTRLLDAALEELEAAGRTAAVLWVMASNARARRFYEARGWQPDGQEVTRNFDVLVVDEVRYHRPGP